MSRMNWLWALRPLFDSLKAFHCDSRKRHIEKANFLEALEKVRPTLDLRDPDAVGTEGVSDQEAQINFQTAW